MKDKSQIIDRIRKCLLKGDSTRNNSQAEVEVALAMAHKLMTEHNIAMTDVQFNSSAGTMKEGITEQYSTVKLGSTRWRLYLAAVTDILCNTKHYQTRKVIDGKIQKVLVFIGTKQDIELAIELFTDLVKAVKHIRRGQSENVAAFSSGVATCLYHRAKEMKKEQVYPTNTTAMIVVKDKDIQIYMAKIPGLVHTNSKARRVNGSAYDAGYSAGKNVALGAKRVGGSLRLSHGG